MHKPAHILIIDDTESNRYTFSRLLKKAHYETTETSTIAEGFSLLNNGRFDLIILDVQLPDGNGFEMCARIKSDPALQAVPILMTSASFVEGRDRALGLDIGAEGYLTTPIDALELVATVKSLLRVRDAEQKLKEALEKAEMASNAKTDFLANMSHEIRTPMNAIVGLTTILASTPLSPKQQEFVATLKQSADSLMNLINDLLDITKIEENKIELEDTPFSLTALFDRVATLARTQLQNGVTIDYAQDNSMPDWYSGDPQRLYQVVLNIVSNAVKFTKKGYVRLSAYAAKKADGTCVYIRIEDSGIGIQAEKLALIFNKFTQADTSTTRKYGGSGLGLAIAKQLAEHMHGRITVESEIGKGSVFTLEVPLKPCARPQDVSRIITANAEIIARGHGLVLLVEDHPPNILVAATLLDQFGYECIAASNGKEALALFKQKQFDVVLMDIQMQDMDGYEVTRQIREWEQQQKSRRTPVIAITANVLMGDKEKCLQAGMDDYLSKPINHFELEKMLARTVTK